MKFDKTILNKVIILPLGLVILFIVYRTLVFSVIMNLYTDHAGTLYYRGNDKKLH